jgi:hypothetical protein
MPPCAVCGLDHPFGQKFCRGCGSRLSEAALSSSASLPATGGECPACGQPTGEGVKFCRVCGTALAAAEKPAATPPTALARPMARDSGDRLATVGQQDLGGMIASSPEVMAEVSETRDRRPWVAGSVIVVVMLLAGGGWYFLSSKVSVNSRPDEGLASLRATDAPIAVQPASAPEPEKIGEPIITTPAVQPSVQEAASTEVPRRDGAERSTPVPAAQDVARERRQQDPAGDAERLKAEAVEAQRRLAAAFEGDATKANSETPQRREEAAREAERNKAAEGQQRRDDAAWVAAAEAARRPPAEEPAVQTLEIPAGTEASVRLATKLNSGSVHVEDRFDALMQEDLKIAGRTLVPAGSVMRGIVSSVEPASRTNRTARMTLAFDLLTVDGRAYPIRAQVTQVLAGSGLKGEATKIAVGAGIGGLIGGMLGGAKGAIAGTLIGSGGSIAATEGKQVELPQGTVLRTRIDAPVQIHLK